MGLPELKKITTDSETEIKSSVELTPDNCLQFIETMTCICGALGEEVNFMIRNLPFVSTLKCPSFEDLCVDRSTGLPISQTLFKYKDKAGVDPTSNQMLLYEKDFQAYTVKTEKRKANLSTLCLNTQRFISERSNQVMKSTDPSLFAKAQTDAESLWKLIHRTHRVSLIKSKMIALENIMTCRMEDSDYVDFLNKLVENMQRLREALGDITAKTAEQLLQEIFTTILLVNVNQDSFSYQINKIMDSDFPVANYNYQYIAQMLSTAYLNSGAARNYGLASLGAIDSVCASCHLRFPYATNGSSGKPYQLCRLCWAKQKENSVSNPREKVTNPNLSIAELQKMLAKAQKDKDTPKKNSNSSVTVEKAPKIAKKLVITNKNNSAIVVNPGTVSKALPVIVKAGEDMEDEETCDY